jgi:hypothetical protein
MLENGASSFGLGLDFAILLTSAAILVMIGARLYPRVII